MITIVSFHFTFQSVLFPLMPGGIASGLGHIFDLTRENVSEIHFVRVYVNSSYFYE